MGIQIVETASVPPLHPSSDLNSILELKQSANTSYSALVSTPVNMAEHFYDLSAKLLSGDNLSFSSLKGKVVLIENVASL